MTMNNQEKEKRSTSRKFHRILEDIATEGTVTRISGKMRSGKSDFTLRICEIILGKIDPDLKILTNIQIDWKEYEENRGKPHPLQDRFILVTSLSKLFYTIPTVKRGILITDEAGIFASTGASGRRSDLGQWEQIVKLIRKFHLGIIWIDQRGKGSTPPTIREMCSYHIHKPYKYRAEIYDVEYDHKRDDVKERLRIALKVTPHYRTSIPYDTYAPGSFFMELGTRIQIQANGKEKEIPLTARDVFDALANVRGRDIGPALLNWLKYHNITEENFLPIIEGEEEEEEKDSLPRSLSMKEIVFYLMDRAEKEEKDPPETKTLAKILMGHPGTISRIKKQWKDERSPGDPEEIKIPDTKESSPPEGIEIWDPIPVQ